MLWADGTSSSVRLEFPSPSNADPARSSVRRPNPATLNPRWHIEHEVHRSVSKPSRKNGRTPADLGFLKEGDHAPEAVYPTVMADSNPEPPSPEYVGATAVPSALPPSGRMPLLRIALLCLVLATAIGVVYLSPIGAWLKDKDALRTTLDALGIWAFPLFILAVAGLVAGGMPRLLFCGLGGWLFGFWTALLLNETATLLAYYGVFLFVRWGGRDWVLHKWPKLQRWADTIQKQGTLGVILVRQVPVHGTLINLCLGLSRLRHRDFLLGTAIGIIPEAIPATLIGAGLASANLKRSVTLIVLAVVCFVVIGLACRYLIRRRSNAAVESLPSFVPLGEDPLLNAEGSDALRLSPDAALPLFPGRHTA